MKKEILSFKTLLLLIGFSLFALSSCEDDDNDVIPDDPLPESVVDVITGSDDHNTLAAAVTAAGLVPTLQGTGPFTVFAPTDAAFDALPEGTVEALLDDPEGDLTDILLYHVLGNKVMSGSLSNGMKVSSLLGEDLTITLDNGNVFVNGAQVTVADVETQNGVVHVIDAVLIPEEEEPLPATVVDIIAGSEDHTTLAAAATAADLLGALSGEGPFTVFAPTDAAFEALPEGTVEALLADPSGELTEILLYHVVGAKAMAMDLSDGQEIETLNGDKVMVSINGGVYINDAQVTVADIEAENGVVHVIDAVLIPEEPLPATVVDIIAGSEDHTTLAAAATAADLLGALSGEGPFTVFAPTDAAFEALPEGTVEALLADPSGDLTDILLYHVVAGKAMSGDLSDGLEIETLFGENITVTINNDGVFINDAEVTVADIEAENGVVHVIDAVLLPGEESSTIVEIASSENDFMTLVAALGLFPDLVAALDGEGDFTVFAPTNEAFAALLNAIGQTDLEDIPESVVREILEYHVIATTVFSGDLTSGDVTTFGGESISVDISDGVVLNGSVNVTNADIEASNGVVHVIDGVLVPPSIAPVVGTIVAPAFFNKDFSTLVAAVLAADEDILSVLLGDGPFTLFAPTNAAFEAAGITSLPDGATLSAVLKYHVISGEVQAADLPAGSAAIETLGGKFYLSNNGSEGVFINGTTEVIATDIEGSNGVVHVIDRTLLPPSQSIAEIVVDMASGDDPEFTQLLAALARTDGEDPDLLAAVSGDGDLTVFAPTDAAFQALYTALSVDGIDNIDLGTLTAVLTHHVVGARVFSTDLTSGPVTTLNGDVTIDTSNLTITDGQGNVAELVVSLLNVHATNGVIHVIDKVLLP